VAEAAWLVTAVMASILVAVLDMAEPLVAKALLVLLVVRVALATLLLQQALMVVTVAEAVLAVATAWEPKAEQVALVQYLFITRRGKYVKNICSY
jgi:hypothetical protein